MRAKRAEDLLFGRIGFHRSVRTNVTWDDNVHPANTIQLVDDLIKANKTFDLIIAPNRNHGLNEPYFIRRRWDYFVQYLLGETPPLNYEIVRPVEPGGSPP